MNVLTAHIATDVRLGAAGCLYANGDRCTSLRADMAGYVCTRYRVPLAEYWRDGQPVRANVCGDEAGKDSCSRIMRARQ